MLKQVKSKHNSSRSVQPLTKNTVIENIYYKEGNLNQKMDIDELISHLNTEQQQAATSDQKNLLIIAGAGTGKTQTIIHRIAWLLISGRAKPHNIIATTFTNKAAHELRARITGMIGDDTKGMWCNTMHSLCVKILSMYSKEAGLRETFTILDTRKKARTLATVITNLMNSGSISSNLEVDEKAIAAKIGIEKECGRRSSNSDLSDIDLKIFKAYEAECNANSFVDFDELILRTCELLANNLEVRDYFHGKFRYVLLDEYQDTSYLQAKFIDLITGENSSLTAVGDPDQSIYGWRGAGLGMINRLNTLDENADISIVTLKQNYRSTNTILKLANQLIQNNYRNSKNKELFSAYDEVIPVKYWEAYNQDDEAWQVVNEIQRHRSEGGLLADCAVLYRTGAQSRLFEKLLKDREIPYKISGGIAFFARAEILNVHAYLHLLFNPNDFLSLQRAISIPRRGIGAKTLENLRNAGGGIEALWENLKASTQGSTKRAKSILEFCSSIELLQKIFLNASNIGQVVEACVEEINLMDSFRQKDNDEAYRSREDNIEELKEYASRYVITKADNPLDILRDYLNSVSLQSDVGMKENADCVNLMTMHASKGLEFDRVFVVGAEDQLLPHSNHSRQSNEIDEERRILYVAVTRAKRHLIVTRAKERFNYNKVTYTLPSRFLYEIAEHLEGFAEVENNQPDSVPFEEKRKKIIENSLADSLLNSEVMHKKFGSGVVESVQGTDNMTLKIRFTGNNIKHILYRPEFLKIVS